MTDHDEAIRDLAIKHYGNARADSERQRVEETAQQWHEGLAGLTSGLID